MSSAQAKKEVPRSINNPIISKNPIKTKSIRVLKSVNKSKDCDKNPVTTSNSNSGSDDDDINSNQEGEQRTTVGQQNSEFKVKQKSKNAIYCSGFSDSLCMCNTIESVPLKVSRTPNELNRRFISIERLNELRKKTHEAIKNHKVFTIRGCFYTVRKSLIERGWVEKLDIHRRASMPCNLTLDEMLHQLPGRRVGESKRQYLIKCERNIISRFLEYTPVDFLWTVRKEKADFIDMARNPTLILNKFHKVPFTSKEGLCSSLRDFQWYFIDGLSEMYYPRCFNVFNQDELNDFIDDFRLTACIGILKWFTETYQEKGLNSIVSSHGTIPMTSIQFAIKRCREFVNSCEHYDIDSCDNMPKIWDHDWDVFLTHHYLLTHEDGRISDNQQGQIECFLSMAEKVLKDVQPFWSAYHPDGFLNIWIIKPGNRCRGKGIILMNNLKKIINMVNPSTITKQRYVVQKYMERPLTIHNTKFDIRQWFLVTSVQPLVVWMYKDSYLRFSSQEYNLLNYHESVHLTNHAIQKKYVNGTRDERLPIENMWDNYTFQTYLRQIGKFEMWDERIYPGMQKAIIGSMLASQESMDRRPNTFELFGADFMICEDFRPWLIEINSSPDLGSTTSVTARMCPQCLFDVVKVVIDRRNDPKADTGGFEMIYKQNIPPAPAYMGLNLFLKGQQISQKPTMQKKEKTRDDIRPIPRPFTRQVTSHKTEIPKEEKAHQGPVIMDLIDCLTGKPNLNSNIRKSLSLTKKQPNTPQSRSQTSLLKSRTKLDLDKREKNDLNQHRRHNSCGPPPKLITPRAETESKLTENNVLRKIAKELTCVGNKFCPDKLMVEAGDLTSSSSPATSRKPSYENIIYKSKSATNLATVCQKSQNQRRNELRSLSEKKGDSKTWPSKKLDNKGNMYAIGLSLKAWRAKYNKVLDKKI